MKTQITLNGKTFQYSNSEVYRNGQLVYQGQVTMVVLNIIANAVA